MHQNCLVLSFVPGGTVSVSMKMRYFHGILSKFSYSYTVSSRVDLQTQFSMWTTTGGVEMMSNCISYEKMHDFDKTFENRGSDGQNSFQHTLLFHEKHPQEKLLLPL